MKRQKARVRKQIERAKRKAEESPAKTQKTRVKTDQTRVRNKNAARKAWAKRKEELSPADLCIFKKSFLLLTLINS